ncbi:2586_t:CDS:2, partial [Paraglomus occultum]
VDEYISPITKVVGIGSGSTVVYVIERILQRELIVQNGLTLGDVDAYPEIDVTIDGADENSKVLGEKWIQGVPIEVIPFAYTRVIMALKTLGCDNPVLRMAMAKAGP